ncbi:Hydrogen cyanide synthase subunit HcnA [Pseudovibrio axinellae]|uniref:Hydrogen cyanide synthase subunit HcnA n=1 Tax=Pseudovibrio axinellae TaxID=989403 RepID=A0A165VZM5_9HYPH|nr:(2Fe-2S)-binding protein [Pseudovibrio axinellae]KZL15721.1 Hydrogen cyanide synthase subunit HcnA [Pseudovibrio axinellae]SER69655.1 hydrogen cyanide synthase HcnA [Pseudovibrio axinellae]
MTKEFQKTCNAVPLRAGEAFKDNIPVAIPAVKRKQDITEIVDRPFTINVDGVSFPALEGENVLSALLASDIRQLMKSDYGTLSGAYCGMGVCHCCLLHIDGKHKQRACQTIVRPGMRIQTQRNMVLEQEEKHDR